MMKIGGKSPSNKVTPFAVSETGETLVKRVWETSNRSLMAAYINYEWFGTDTDSQGNKIERYRAVAKTDYMDVKDWGFTSLRLMNSTTYKAVTQKDENGKDKVVSVVYTAPIKVNLYGDRTANDQNYVKNINGENLVFTLPTGTEITVIPEELPVLNYLQHIAARLEIDTSSLQNETINITKYLPDGSSVVEPVPVTKAAEMTIDAAKNNYTVVPTVEIKAYVNFNVITKR